MCLEQRPITARGNTIMDPIENVRIIAAWETASPLKTNTRSSKSVQNQRNELFKATMCS